MAINNRLYRSCSRCRKGLIDPASQEAGIGPICRGKNNHLYAKTIKANLPQASAIALGIESVNLAEPCRRRWDEFRLKFIRQMRKTENITDFNFIGGDFRDCIKDIDWFLSHPQSITTRHQLITIVDALGYVGLASVLSGDAALSPAKVYIKGSFIYLEGKACKPGFLSMRKIHGIKTPRFRGDKTPYRIHASNGKLFFEAVRRHWPMYNADLDELLKEAKEIAKKSPEEKPVTTAIINLRSDDMTIKFPWLRSIPMREVIDSIKKVPYSDRRWLPKEKLWTVKKKHLKEVSQSLGKFFEKVVINNTNERTPGSTGVQ